MKTESPLIVSCFLIWWHDRSELSVVRSSWHYHQGCKEGPGYVLDQIPSPLILPSSVWKSQLLPQCSTQKEIINIGSMITVSFQKLKYAWCFILNWNRKLNYLHPYKARTCIWGQAADHMVVYFTSVKLDFFLQSDSCHPYPPLMAYIAKQRWWWYSYRNHGELKKYRESNNHLALGLRKRWLLWDNHRSSRCQTPRSWQHSHLSTCGLTQVATSCLLQGSLYQRRN